MHFLLMSPLHDAHLQLCLEEELLWALRAVVDLILLAVGRKDVLLELIGVDKHCSEKRDVESGEKMLAWIFKDVSKKGHYKMLLLCAIVS